MPRTFDIITGHGRRPLISDASSQLTAAGSRDFGQFDVARYSRFAGYIQASSVGVNGLILRWRFSPQSGGPWQATSSTTISSGATAYSGTIVDIINYGQYAYFDIVSVDSTTIYTALLNAEPMR